MKWAKDVIYHSTIGPIQYKDHDCLLLCLDVLIMIYIADEKGHSSFYAFSCPCDVVTCTMNTAI